MHHECVARTNGGEEVVAGGRGRGEASKVDSAVVREWWLAQGMPERLDDPAVIDALVKLAFPQVAPRKDRTAKTGSAGTPPSGDQPREARPAQ